MSRRPDAYQKRFIRSQLIARDGRKCKWCDKPLNEHSITIDHIIPIWRNGSNKLTNLQILCFDCHKIKSKEDRNFRVPDFMFHRWVIAIQMYRHRAFLRKLLGVKRKRKK